jgi:hypothetical protein
MWKKQLSNGNIETHFWVEKVRSKNFIINIFQRESNPKEE